MLNKLIIFLLLISAVCFPADFFNYFKEYNKNLYSTEKKIFSKISVENKWFIITEIYYEFYKFRMGAELNLDLFEDKIDGAVDRLENGEITNVTTYEKEITISMMYGIKYSINTSDTSVGNIRDLKKYYNLSEIINDNYKNIESNFSYALAEVTAAIYFEDSFWINNVLGYKGNIVRSIKSLEKLSGSDNLFNIESNLFLIEFYSNLLLDHRSSLKFTKYLNELFPTSKYFKFLYAKDLYYTGKIDKAFNFFKEVNTEISNEYYPYEYSSLIYEIKCLYLQDRGDFAVEVLKYAKNIHEGYLTEELDKWKYSLKRRKDIIHRFERLNFRDIKDIVKNEHDKKLTMNLLFEHSYFKELFSLINYEDKPEFLLLYFRSTLILGEYIAAKQLFSVLETKYEDFLDDHQDIGRIMILKNILDNVEINQ